MQVGFTVQCSAMWGTAFKLGLGWAGGEYASAGKRDNFDKGEEEDDAAHNFKRSDHVLPMDNMYIEHICK